MKKRLLAMCLPALVLVACGSDDVPAVDDPHNVVVDGQKMTQAEFLRKFCVGKGHNETCLRVNQAMVSDATKGAPPRGW